MTPARRAQLALLLEVAATPTPGTVDRDRDHTSLRFEHLLAGAVGATEGLSAAAAGAPLGEAFETAVEGMAQAQRGGNTQFGAILVLLPLVRATATDELSPAGVTRVVETTTVDDAVAFCRAFASVPVALEAPPDELADIDVRDPTAAAEAVERRELTLAELMAESATVDGIAREWVTGYERTFEAAASIRRRDGPVPDRAAAAFLEMLAAEPDTHVATRHGADTAEWVREAASAVLAGERDPEDLAATLVDEGINPGTTADLLAASLYVALERGMTV